MKIVIDTNLLVAAFFNKRSASFKILEMAKRREIEIFWTEPIRREAEEILGNILHSLAAISKSYPRTQKSAIMNKVFKKENKIERTPRINVVKEDPADNKFLACAIGAGAGLIITNDHHLLKLKSFKGIPILTPTQALKKCQKLKK